MTSSLDEYDEAMSQFFNVVFVAALPWEDQQRIAGGTGAGVAWEVRNDLRQDGEWFLGRADGRLTREQVQTIRIFLDAIQTIPEFVFDCTGSGPGIGLRNSEWNAQRLRSRDLLASFDAEIRASFTRIGEDLSIHDKLLAEQRLAQQK